MWNHCWRLRLVSEAHAPSRRQWALPPSPPRASSPRAAPQSHDVPRTPHAAPTNRLRREFPVHPTTSTAARAPGRRPRPPRCPGTTLHYLLAGRERPCSCIPLLHGDARPPRLREVVKTVTLFRGKDLYRCEQSLTRHVGWLTSSGSGCACQVSYVLCSKEVIVITSRFHHHNH